MIKIFVYMKFKQQIKEGGFKYIKEGEGKPIIILHGLMGGLGNFEGFISHFPKTGYQTLMLNTLRNL